MDALVVYESLYGNTAKIAKAIGEGLTGRGLAAKVLPVDDVEPGVTEDVELLVVGGPTHAHGMTSKATRTQAANDQKNPFGDPTVTPGLRTWLRHLPSGYGRPVAAFDTRFHKSALITGSAAKGIAKRLDHQGYVPGRTESFFVTTDNTLVAGEEDRARAWGAGLAEMLGRDD